jgi:hypothetical protein
MAPFDLKSFLDKPSWEVFDKCRGVDLMTVADHYSLSIPQSLVKVEVKQLVLNVLLEEQVLVLPLPEPTTHVGEVAAPVSLLVSENEGEPKLQPHCPVLNHSPHCHMVMPGGLIKKNENSGRWS